MPFREMSLREKSAWITLVTVLLSAGAYIGPILAGWVDGRSHMTVYLLAHSVTALVVLQAALHLWAGWTTPRDSRAPRDEREAAILARSHTLGYYVLLVSVLTLFLPAHFGHPVSDLLNLLLLDVVLAVLTVAIAQIVMFRRGG
jgi:hypothetical protein